MQKAVENLVRNHQVSLSDPQVRKNIEIIENSPDEEVEKEIDKQYRPTFLTIGTSGNYLWGNRQSYYGEVHPGCSALAINGRGYQGGCAYSVWSYQDKELINILINKSPRAYIYVYSDWEKFSQDDMEKLVNAGIKEVAIFETVNSVHTELHSMKPLSQYDVQVYQEKPFQKTDNWSWIFMLIFAVGLISALSFYR